MATPIANLPEVRHTRCVRYRFRYSDCCRCAESCPPGALSLGEEGVSIDATLCSGCGLCAATCPTATFHLPAFPIASLTKPAVKHLSIVCSPSGQVADVRIPCLGDLDPALLASLALRGIALTLHGAGHCSDCANAPHGGERVAALEIALEELGQLAAQSWTAPLIETESAVAEHQADRRQLFRRFTNLAVESVRKETVTDAIPESAIRAAAHFVPPRRELAELVLVRLGSLADDSPLPLLLDIAEIVPREGRCTGCGACARVCPTGALKVAEVETQWSLQFRARQCIGCAVCIESCGPAALQLKHRWHAQGEGETASMLHSLPRYLCQECGRYFIGLDEETCPVCRDDQENFDAIFG